jgi:malate dehydrogenase
MGVVSEGAYGVPEGLFFGYPVTTEGGDYRIVEGLTIDAFARAMIDTNTRELVAEREVVKALLPGLFT